MKTQHTPGPWTAHGTVVNQEGERFEYPVATTGISPVPTEEAFANARLIAAAPELLAACQRALTVLCEYDFDPYTDAGDILRAAIAKAAGGAK